MEQLTEHQRKILKNLIFDGDVPDEIIKETGSISQEQLRELVVLSQQLKRAKKCNVSVVCCTIYNRTACNWKFAGTIR